MDDTSTCLDIYQRQMLLGAACTVLPRVPDRPSSDAIFTYPSPLVLPLLRKSFIRCTLNSSPCHGVRLRVVRFLGSCGLSPQDASPVNTSHLLAILTCCPLLKAPTVDVVAACRSAPDDILAIVQTKGHKADRTVSFNCFSIRRSLVVVVWTTGRRQRTPGKDLP